MDEAADSLVSEDRQLGVHVAQHLCDLQAQELSAPLGQWLQAESRWRRKKAFQLLQSYPDQQQLLRDQLLRWLQSSEKQDIELAGNLLAKSALVDEQILRLLVSWWLSTDGALAPFGAQVLGAIWSKSPQHRPLFASVLREHLHSTNLVFSGIAARHLIELDHHDTDTITVLVRAALSPSGRVQELQEVLGKAQPTISGAILDTVAAQLEGAEAQAAAQAYALLREYDAAPEQRIRWLRRELLRVNLWDRVRLAVDLAELAPDQGGVDALVGLLGTSFDELDGKECVKAAAAALLSIHRERDRALSALNRVASSGLGDEAIEAIRLLHKHGRVDEPLKVQIRQWIRELASESYLRRQVGELLEVMGESVPDPLPEVELERHLRTLASSGARARGDAAWDEVQRQLALLDPVASPQRQRVKQREAWWPTASSLTTRASGLAEHFPQLPPHLASILLRWALPEAPAELSGWLLGPRPGPPAELVSHLARLVNVQGKDETGRFASAFWFAHMKLA